jgi:hypothetical protein
MLGNFWVDAQVTTSQEGLRYMELISLSLCDHLSVCMSVYPHQFLNALTNFYEIWYVYHGT